jgi:ribonuclease P protein component
MASAHRASNFESPTLEGPQEAVGLIERLHGRDGFARLRREGTRFRSGVVWCVMVSDPSLDGPQVAFAIGRTAGTAVKRNRVRRQLREVLRKHSSDLGPGLYLMGLTRPAADISYVDVSQSVTGLLTKWSDQS